MLLGCCLPSTGPAPDCEPGFLLIALWLLTSRAKPAKVAGMEHITLAEYVDGVEKTLKLWLDVHTDPKAWAEHWIDPHGSAAELFKAYSAVFSNDHFHCDVRYRLYEEKAKGMDLYRCTECGFTDEDATECPDCGGVVEEMSLEEATEELMEVFELDYVIDSLPEKTLEDILIHEVFPVYREAVAPVTEEIEEQVRATLDRFAEATSNEERLLAAMAGTSVYHVSGNIMEDYASSVPDFYVSFETIDRVRKHGLEQVFGRDEVEEYLFG